MSDFNALLNAPEEMLLQRFYQYKDGPGDQLADIAKHNRLRAEQLICAVGFNLSSRHLPEILPVLGYASFDALSQSRNAIFIADVYRTLPLDDVLSIYATVKGEDEALEIMQYLLGRRLEKVESRIEETVNSSIIDKYKTEIRFIYNNHIAGIDFVEARLNRQDSGFRALLNEVSMIIESKLIPAGDIFFRDSILPEEKRRLLDKGRIPEELVQARLDDETTTADEKRVLQEYLINTKHSKVNNP